MSERLGTVEYVNQVLNADKSTPELPLVVALHWSGSSPTEFARHFALVKTPARLVLPRGKWPRRAGFSHFPTDPYFYDLAPEEQRAILRRQGDELGDFLVRLQRKYPTAGKPILVGASQGGDLAFVVAARHPGLVRLAIPLMGKLDLDAVGDCSSARVHVLHGREDVVVPIDLARAAALRLLYCGANVAIFELPGVGHDLPPLMEREMARIIDASLTDSSMSGKR